MPTRLSTRRRRGRRRTNDVVTVSGDVKGGRHAAALMAVVVVVVVVAVPPYPAHRETDCERRGAGSRPPPLLSLGLVWTFATLSWLHLALVAGGRRINPLTAWTPRTHARDAAPVRGAPGQPLISASSSGVRR
ncbi:hypothetical protein E2C01_083827 [Portunus trituberculatus]|uniref:Uncharacterized protein n=1 Tax=Portunus trituberculatus TaxID=210409 RepID=A0A5B7J384_PORTR|nr:hypothetical protein [Portunus trituberculatus]